MTINRKSLVNADNLLAVGYCCGFDMTDSDTPAQDKRDADYLKA